MASVKEESIFCTALHNITATGVMEKVNYIFNGKFLYFEINFVHTDDNKKKYSLLYLQNRKHGTK